MFHVKIEFMKFNNTGYILYCMSNFIKYRRQKIIEILVFIIRVHCTANSTNIFHSL